MPAKERLDQLLVARGLAPSRTRAQALIRAGRVTVDGLLSDKPGTSIAADADVAVHDTDPYVGRGAHKLVGALRAFRLDPRDAVCLDVGASTGGFTDALLQHGAARVYAVDVGRGQLAWRLRQDPRVVVMERTDIRAVEALPETPDLVTVDVAFISLRLVLPPIAALVGGASRVLCLVKPQFEAGRSRVGRGGVVRDPKVHRDVLESVATWMGANGWAVLDGAASPVAGASGNREFWLLLAPAAEGAEPPDVARALERALAGNEREGA